MKISLKLLMSSAMIALTFSVPQPIYGMENSLKAAEEKKRSGIQLSRDDDRPLQALDVQEKIHRNKRRKLAQLEGGEIKLPSKSIFSQLPIELQVYVFSFLEQKDFLRASHVCHEWREVSSIAGNSRSFDLSGRKLGQEGCQVLLRVPFSALVLRGCCLGYQETFILSRAAWLKEVDLSNNGIGDAGVIALVFDNLTSPNSRSLRLNSIRRVRGAIAIANNNLTNSNLPTLTSLNLAGNNIGVEGVKVIAKGNFAALKSLNLSTNYYIGAVGAKAIANGNLTALNTLNLARSNIEDDGAKAIANGNLTALNTLNLASNNIGDEGATAIANGNLTALNTLDLTQNCIGEQGKESLRKSKSIINLTWWPVCNRQYTPCRILHEDPTLSVSSGWFLRDPERL